MEYHPSLSGILDAICKMDSVLLQNSLSGDSICFELNKTRFVEKMEELFESLKLNGNSHFNVYKGLCNGKTCCNYQCPGYIFVTNHTREYFNFVMEISVVEALEFTKCYAFSTDHYLPNLGAQIEIKIFDDEKYNFYPDEEYLQTIEIIKTATEHLDQLSTPYLSKDNILIWVNKYSDTFDNFRFIWKLYNYDAYRSFGDIFLTILNIKTLFDKESEFEKALSIVESYSQDQFGEWYESNQYLLKQFADFNIYSTNSDNTYTIKYTQYIFDPAEFTNIISYAETAKYLMS